MIAEKLLYTTNKLAYNLTLLIIAINTIILILTLNQMDVNLTIGIYIILNLVLTLFLFLMAVKISTYNVLWTKLAFIMIIVSILRVFFIPSGVSHNLTYATMASYFVSAVIFLIIAKTTQKKIKLRGDMHGSTNTE